LPFRSNGANKNVIVSNADGGNGDRRRRKR